MRVKVLKKSIDRKIKYNLDARNYEYFIKKVFQSRIIKETTKYFIINIKENSLKKQVFKGKEWYQSIDEKYGVFRDDTMKFNSTKEKGWRVLFQNK